MTVGYVHVICTLPKKDPALAGRNSLAWLLSRPLSYLRRAVGGGGQQTGCTCYAGMHGQPLTVHHRRTASSKALPHPPGVKISESVTTRKAKGAEKGGSLELNCQKSRKAVLQSVEPARSGGVAARSCDPAGGGKKTPDELHTQREIQPYLQARADFNPAARDGTQPAPQSLSPFTPPSRRGPGGSTAISASCPASRGRQNLGRGHSVSLSWCAAVEWL